MKRRTFLTLLAGISLAPTIALGGVGVDFEPGLIKKELAAGKTVMVDYYADWCGVCKRQARIINELRANNAEYDENITFVRVDWDKFEDKPVSMSRDIPRRSTLLVLRGDEELGRVVASTKVDTIKSLMDSALQ